MTSDVNDLIGSMPLSGDNGDGKRHLVMVAAAGHSDRTGAKVHVATMIVWPNGTRTVGATHCSDRRPLRGSVVRGKDFTAVTCAKCAGHDVRFTANARNAKLEWL